MEKVLVTGGAGYLGSVLVGRLLNRKYRVTVLDNLFYNQVSLLQYAGHPHFEFILGDMMNGPLMQGLLKTHDIIIPLAAIVGMKACDSNPQLARALNLDAIKQILDFRSANQRIIFPCTNSGYGTKSAQLYCDENTSLEPVSLYGQIKVEAERILLNSNNVISLRMATVFGPSPRMRIELLVNDFVYRAIKDGFLVIFEKDFKRNYIHIEDVAECFCFSLEHFAEMKNEAYNVGLSDANLSKEELALKIKTHIPSLYINYAEVGSDPDRRNYIISNEKIKQRGFVARHSLDEGIQQLIKAYKMLPARSNFNNY